MLISVDKVMHQAAVIVNFTLKINYYVLCPSLI